ncbi:MAG: hypothetical protein R2712_23320 [Vicinamibacterales bacterium]
MFLPLVKRLDFTVAQTSSRRSGRRHSFQFRMDFHQLRQPAEQELGR